LDWELHSEACIDGLGGIQLQEIPVKRVWL
jgi:hypothetical protein